MSITTSTDPRQTILDLLDNTTDSDWTQAGSKPTILERQEEVSQSTKGNRRDDAVYCYQPTDETTSQFGYSYDRYQNSADVTADVWTPTSQSQARALAEDIQTILFQYVNDNKSATDWHRIRPVSVTDLRHEKIADQGDHYRVQVEVRLRALRAP